MPVIYVDYPAEASLKQIYGTFNRAMLRLIPALKGYADPLTNAMVEFFLSTQERYTQEQQPHYIYSPRELTRWVRGVCEAIRPLAQLTLEGLVRLWAHEALRLFHDRCALTASHSSHPAFIAFTVHGFKVASLLVRSDRVILCDSDCVSTTCQLKP